MSLRWLDDAEMELDEALQWCESQAVGLSERLPAEVTAGVELIERFQLAWHPVGKYIRSHRLNKFSYSLIYTTAKEDGCVIVALAHQQRRLAYWRARLKTL